MEIMSRFELERLAWRCFGALSGGEAQRLMLARAVAKAPDLLLVDEPTAQLDRVAARTVNDVLANIGGKQGIVVVATHDSDTAAVCPIRIDLGDWAPGARRPGRGNHRAGQMRGTSETTSAAGTEL
jgi:ABC-type lipoprotein export system ATPase subunit